MTDERILEIAHRTATRYAHTAVDPATAFAFNKTHMIDFGRKVLAGAAQPDCRTCEHKPLYARDNALCYRVNCVNGNEYIETRKVVLWRTE